MPVPAASLDPAAQTAQLPDSPSSARVVQLAMPLSAAITVIVNEGSGGASAVGSETLEQAFVRAGLDARIRRVRSQQIVSEATRAAGEGHVLVAAGGDGTVSSVASVAVQHGATFGVVPLGTLNHFARDAGIPTDLAEAIATIAGGRTELLDVGTSNNRIFVNNASLGLYPRLVWEREQEQRRGRGKWAAFSIALFRTWRRYRTLTVRLTVDNVVFVRRTPFVFIGNGEYQAEGMDLGKRQSIGGQLSVYLAPEAGPFEILALPFRALIKRTENVKLEAFTAGDVSIETARPTVDIAFDGEVAILEAPLRCSIRHGALRTLVPEP